VKLPAHRAEHPGSFSSLTKEKIGSIIKNILKTIGQDVFIPAAGDHGLACVAPSVRRTGQARGREAL